MANRKQFVGAAKRDDELDELLKKSRLTPVSNEQLHEQRVSFAFGNSPESQFITKETVRQSSMSIRLVS
jgi:hypothetical protein